MNHHVRHDPFEDLFRGFLVRPVGVDRAEESPRLRIDVKESPTHYTVFADLPGMAKDEIQVDIDGPTVSISAERKGPSEAQEGERFLRSERLVGKIARSFQLGHDIDERKASATFVDGVLTLELPKKLGAQARRLIIQ